MSIDTADIIRKAEQATTSYTAAKISIANNAAVEDLTSTKLGELANQLAQAEGAHTAWLNLKALAEYHAQEGTELTKEGVLAVITELLTQGADDTWSGRGNDLKRARFDGVREACRSMNWAM